MRGLHLPHTLPMVKECYDTIFANLQGLTELRGCQRRGCASSLGGLDVLVYVHRMAENSPKGQEMCRTVYDNGAINTG